MDPAPQMPVGSPAEELQALLGAMVRGIVVDPGNIEVFKAEATGFVHFEIRAPESTLSAIPPKVRDDIRQLMLAAATGRRTRVTMKWVTEDRPLHEAAERGDGIEELNELVLTISRNLVDRPDEVVAFPAKGDGFVHFEVRCDDRDVGAMIGRRAANVDRTRSVVEAAGRIRGIRTSIHVTGRDGS